MLHLGANGVCLAAEATMRALPGGLGGVANTVLRKPYGRGQLIALVRGTVLGATEGPR